MKVWRFPYIGVYYLKQGTQILQNKKLIKSIFYNVWNSRVAGLLADREFASGKFFRWLNVQKVPFYIRIKEGSVIASGNEKILTAKKFFNRLKSKTSKEFPMAVWLFGQKAYLAGSRSE